MPKYHLTFCVEAESTKDADRWAEGISNTEEIVIVKVALCSVDGTDCRDCGLNQSNSLHRDSADCAGCVAPLAHHVFVGDVH